MELHDYLRIARRRWLLIVATTFTLVAAAALVTSQMTPQYASTARVFISTQPDTSAEAFAGGQYSVQRVTSYADMMNGLELAQRVVDQLRLDMTAEELSKKISAKAVPTTVLLDVTVTDPSAIEAQRINEAVVAQLQTMVADIETPPGATQPLLKATVIDPPRLPHAAASPKPTRNLGLGLVVGLLLGFGLAVLREILDNSVKNVSEVPGLAEVPLLAGLAHESEVTKEPLISTLPSHAPRAESFRVLRTNLQFLDVDSRSKAFVVTSSVPAEGKSTTAVNTGIALAQANKKVVLVDADLRKPQVASLLGLESVVGLTTMLLGEVKLEDALQVHQQTGLHVLTAGAIPPNPAELLQSNAMRDVLAQLREAFDIIIIDAPPLLPVTDAALLSAEADGALVVVRQGRTTKDQLAGAVQRLRAVGAAPLGVIVNMIPQKRAFGGGYGYGYGYGYGTGPEGSEIKPTVRQRRELLKLRKKAAQQEHEAS